MGWWVWDDEREEVEERRREWDGEGDSVNVEVVVRVAMGGCDNRREQCFSPREIDHELTVSRRSIKIYVTSCQYSLTY